MNYNKIDDMSVLVTSLNDFILYIHTGLNTMLKTLLKILPFNKDKTTMYVQ